MSNRRGNFLKTLADIAEEQGTNLEVLTQKILKGDAMDVRVAITKIDQSLKGGTGKIQKSERISKGTAESYLNKYADAERSAHPELSPEQAYVRGMDSCQNLAALASGMPQEMVKGVPLKKKPKGDVNQDDQDDEDNED